MAVVRTMRIKMFAHVLYGSIYDFIESANQQKRTSELKLSMSYKNCRIQYSVVYGCWYNNTAVYNTVYPVALGTAMYDSMLF